MTVIQMSERELTRLRVLIDLSDKRLTVDAAGTLMGVERRQVYRLRRAFAKDGRRPWFRASAAVRAITGTARQPARLWRRFAWFALWCVQGFPRGLGRGVTISVLKRNSPC